MTTTPEIEPLLAAHTYELSHFKGQTRICRCGHIPDVDPKSGQTQQDYHRNHVAAVIAARVAAVTAERDEATAAVERVRAIYDAWMAWDGSPGPDGGSHPDSSSPRDRERLRAALSPAPTSNNEETDE